MAGSGTSMALLGIGRTPSYVGAGRDLERKGGACPPKSDGSGRNTGPHVSKRNVRLASAKVAGPFRVGAGGASTSDVGWSHNGPSPAAEPDASSELDRGPLGGGAASITASGATAGILSGPHAHPPEPAVSHTVRLRSDTADPHYLCAYINSRGGRSFIEQNMGRAVGQVNISASTMKKMPIPIPSIGEQRQIAMALREQMRIAEDAREAAKEELLTIDALPAALMRRALGGDF